MAVALLPTPYAWRSCAGILPVGVADPGRADGIASAASRRARRAALRPPPAVSFGGSADTVCEIVCAIGWSATGVARCFGVARNSIAG